MFSFLLVIAVITFLGGTAHTTLPTGAWPHTSGACSDSERAGLPQRVGLTAGRRTGISSRAVPPGVSRRARIHYAPIGERLPLIRRVFHGGNRENPLALPVFRYSWSPRYEACYPRRAANVHLAQGGGPKTRDLELYARAEP
jgi:hypothetical protein